MFTTTSRHATALLTAILVLTGGAIARGGTAAADPSQDEQFGALLEIVDIPSQANMPSLIATAHTGGSPPWRAPIGNTGLTMARMPRCSPR